MLHTDSIAGMCRYAVCPELGWRAMTTRYPVQLERPSLVCVPGGSQTECQAKNDKRRKREKNFQVTAEAGINDVGCLCSYIDIV